MSSRCSRRAASVSAPEDGGDGAILGQGGDRVGGRVFPGRWPPAPRLCLSAVWKPAHSLSVSGPLRQGEKSRREVGEKAGVGSDLRPVLTPGEPSSPALAAALPCCLASPTAQRGLGLFGARPKSPGERGSRWSWRAGKAKAKAPGLAAATSPQRQQQPRPFRALLVQCQAPFVPKTKVPQREREPVSTQGAAARGRGSPPLPPAREESEGTLIKM